MAYDRGLQRGLWEHRVKPTPFGEHRFKKISQREDEEESARQRAQLSLPQAKELMRENVACSRNCKWYIITEVMV